MQAHPGVMLVAGKNRIQFNEIPLNFPKSRQVPCSMCSSIHPCSPFVVLFDLENTLESLETLRLLFLEFTCVGKNLGSHCATESALTLQIASL